ncbi:type I restriction endonuclease subunit R [Paracoccus pantotrophus]|uniref:type I restriction endonuclease subunit R n=1 Tax=Paracoccus pantotrophus TaxID=82367 RepID=UPI000E098541|nr:DEAD/DEAH box helicase family protein [Paracoccus pantotrophus]RDD99821.1 type I restriction endonuclease subunit R [Paracoccus pantotrophus]WGR65426.1 type I restriction endonuclease subunit R [Paracoccus pantotrophus]
MSDLHHEKHLESYIVQKLAAQGWLVGDSAGYDQDYALYPEDLEEWLKVTQGPKWDKLAAMNGDKTREVVMKRLEAALEKDGTMHVLRRGFSIAGCGHLDLSEAAPEDQRNADVLHRYAANRLRVVPQLKYHPGRELAIDLGFFLNGLPLATVELKTDFTQSIEHAKNQYRNDRLPVDPISKRKHALLTFKRGAVVHFAMSDSEIWMTTKLAGENTFFLPFNQGFDGHGGNPPRPDGEYPVAYFWEQICRPDNFLRIFHSFVYVEKKNVVDLKGNWSVKETLIFPRYHQFDAVNAMIADARAKGPGQAYLCEHSAGSGKTSTIAWTAHDLIKLRKEDGKPIFDAAIIVTDRNVLDGQLQDAVQQIDHQKGLIAAIDREKSSKSKSDQLTDAMTKGTPIIVVTIQTFPFAMEAILTEKSLRDKNFAVIIDEAHTSQTGNTASKLQATLALSSKSDMADMTIEDILLEIQRSRTRPSNVSHFAFTATPKHSTMMLFGRPVDPTRPASDDNLPVSFHKYEMRQAIDEGFILDVLEGYVPYKTAFNLGKDMVDDKRVDGKAAKRALAAWMALHPTNVTQKVRFIMEHFSKNVAHRLDGKAKAMVVTSSRAAAVRYKKAFDAFIEANPAYKEIRALVAFSGKLTGKEVMHPNDDLLTDDIFTVDEDVEFTESNMNPGIGGQDLRIAFDRPEYRVMLVANKFQTGFDQPKLVAMYIDKKIANAVEIVQTLSRLNRTFPGKDQVFIIDFVNDPNSVQAAFAQYDSGAKIEQVQDLNVIYDIKERLDTEGIYDDGHVLNFMTARYQTAAAFNTGGQTEHRAMFAATQEPTDTFNERLRGLRDVAQAAENAFERASLDGDDAGMKKADHDRARVAEAIGQMMEFKKGLGRFARTYSYIAQLIDLGDPELENFASFAKLLENRLNGIPPENVDLRGITLTGYDIKTRPPEGTDGENGGSGDKKGLILKPEGSGGAARPGSVPVYIQEIISKLNSIFGEATPLNDQFSLVNQIVAIIRENAVVMAQVERNDKTSAMKGNLPGAVEAAIARAMSSHATLATLLLKSDRQAIKLLIPMIYDLLKQGGQIEIGQ